MNPLQLLRLEAPNKICRVVWLSDSAFLRNFSIILWVRIALEVKRLTTQWDVWIQFLAEISLITTPKSPLQLTQTLTQLVRMALSSGVMLQGGETDNSVPYIV
jgi:hypothetical protein